MAKGTTQLANLIDPEVMADMISGKIGSRIVVSPIAKVDTTLVGQAGDTITVPVYGYIGDAEDIAEGASITADQLSATTTQATVKKAMKAVTLTDEAVLSGYGDPVAETNNQLAKAIASKIDVDAMDALQGAVLKYDGSASKISYQGIVDAIDVFDEEFNSDKVMFINPAQVGTLRKDADFIAVDKIAGDLMMTGAIGKIANTEVVVSKKVPLNADSTAYLCPIVKLNGDADSEDETSALTIYMKRDINLETERNTLSRSTDISVDEMYTVALSNSAKVVLASFKK